MDGVDGEVDIGSTRGEECYASATRLLHVM